MTSVYQGRARSFALFGAALLLSLTAFAADSPPPPENNPVWKQLRASLFQDRPINAGGAQLVEVVAPMRADDAAVVPVSVKIRAPQTPQHYIKSIHIIIDNNPAPLVAVFHMTPETGRADLDIRVRVEEYTHVRAVTEMNDGALSMSTAYVKSSGGCSAPAGKDAAEASANLGRMKLVIDDQPKLNQPVMARLMVRHPNVTGMAMDQVTRLYDRAYYVRRLAVSYAGKPVMTADLTFAISENPNFRFYFNPKTKGVLAAEVEDTDGMTFTTSLNVEPQ